MRRLLMLCLAAGLCAGVILAAEHGVPAEEDAANTQIWKTVNFVILAAGTVWLTKKYGVPYFHGRTKDIQRDIVEARQLKEAAEAKTAEMELRMANLDTEIEQFRESAKSEIAAEEERLKAATEQSITRMKASAEREIASAAKQARKELKGFAGELALELARQKVRDRMTPGLAAKLIDSFVDDLPGRVN